MGLFGWVRLNSISAVFTIETPKTPYFGFVGNAGMIFRLQTYA